LPERPVQNFCGAQVNAAIFAAQILGAADVEIARKLTAHKEELVRSVAETNARMKKQLARGKKRRA